MINEWIMDDFKLSYRCRAWVTPKQAEKATRITTLLDDFNIQANNVFMNVFQTNWLLQYATEILGHEETEMAVK